MIPPQSLLEYTVGEYGVELAAMYFKVHPRSIEKWCKQYNLAVK